MSMQASAMQYVQEVLSDAAPPNMDPTNDRFIRNYADHLILSRLETLEKLANQIISVNLSQGTEERSYSSTPILTVINETLRNQDTNCNYIATIICLYAQSANLKESVFDAYMEAAVLLLKSLEKNIVQELRNEGNPSVMS